jgi:hypothetical protein
MKIPKTSLTYGLDDRIVLYRIDMKGNKIRLAEQKKPKN